MSRPILSEVAMKQQTDKNYFRNENNSSYIPKFPKPSMHLLNGARSASYGCDSLGLGPLDMKNDSTHDKTLSKKDDDKTFPQKDADTSRTLPPIGVFWDIENCQVPRRKSAIAVVQAVRQKFFDRYREAEFVVVCDVTKENSRVIKELDYAQVNLIHVSAFCKNAVDDKLRQTIRRFADIYTAPAAIILISSDINFAGDLNDLRHRKKLHIILIHNQYISNALILCANEHYDFHDIIDYSICRNFIMEFEGAVEIRVTNLSGSKDFSKIKKRLRRMCENLGGRVSILPKYAFSIRFPNIAYAIRAKKRMAGENVFGRRIKVSNPIPIEEWSFHLSANRKTHSKDDLQICQRVNRKDNDENTVQLNDIYSQKVFTSGDVHTSGAQNMEPSFQQQISKNMVPFFSNNMSSFTFSKVPNIENLKIIQNPTSCSQKSYFNNLETYSGIIGNSLDQNKLHLDTKKFNNIFTNQAECSALRLNNSASNNSESGIHSLENNQLLLAQSQKLQLLAQNALVQRNLAQTAALAQQFATGPVNKTNGNVDPTAGRLIRGVHGGNNNDNNSSTNSSNNNSSDNAVNVPTPIEEDCESLISTDAFFEPIQKSSSQESSSPVDLHISGLDPYMDLMMTKNYLISLFKMHVEVLSVFVFTLTDGNIVASVKVPTLQDAQYAISQLQRRQIGSRRINIAFQNSSKSQRQLVRSQVAQLLSELPQNKTPLFRFTELFKSRFLNSVSVSELKKMRDVCVISEEENGRMISANSKSQANTAQRQEKKEAIIPYCPVHAQKTLSDSESPNFPTVRIGLSVLSKRIERLLESHSGKLPLPSLSDCYQAQFGPLLEDNQGVPLEHLVSCIQGIEISQNQGSFKYLTWSTAGGKAGDEPAKCVSPMLVATMSVFTRELLELLKGTPKCILPFSQFIPSYHRRYGRQCRVSDYGYTKLLDLLESIPHVLQVIGNGSYKMVTLSHRAQIRRFTSDLLRILKSQTNKQIELSNFPNQYEKIIGRVWDPCHYGLCELEDLLNCIPSSTVIKESKDDGQCIISIPKREQTPEEIELTKKFAQEVVELLKRVPNCSMPFNRFVPAYHNQFGRQCRVSSYGCFKLIELFESIPDTVLIEEDSSRGEKYVVLTPSKRLQVLGERVSQILAAEGGKMPLARLDFVYKFYQYESMISPSDYGCDSFEQLLLKIPEYVKIEYNGNNRTVILRNDLDPTILICRIRYVLFETEKLPIGQFMKAYTKLYKTKIDIESTVHKVSELVKLVKKGGETYVQLTPVSLFANQMYLLLFDHRGRLSLPNFESAYLNKFKKSCQPSQFGFPNLSSLLAAIPETVTIQNSGYYAHKRIITLNTSLKSVGFQMPVLNNESCGQKSLFDGSCFDENSSRPYDLWKSDSLFPCWKDINGLLPDNVTVPHPSELPLPSSKLSSPIHKMLQSDSALRDEVEATSTTDENISEELDAAKSKLDFSIDCAGKRKSRIAAQFEKDLM